MMAGRMVVARRLAVRCGGARVGRASFSAGTELDEAKAKELAEAAEAVELEKKWFKKRTEIDITPHWVDDGGVADLDDSECLPENIAELATLDPIMPEVHRNRKVLIFQPEQKECQAAHGKFLVWQLGWEQDFDANWANPLMGWSSSSDPLKSLRLQFQTSDQAIWFAKKNGWNYEVISDPKTRQSANLVNVAGKTKYSHNFLKGGVENELKKNGVKTKQFRMPTSGASHYFRPVRYHGDGEVVQHGKDPDAPWK